MKPRGEILFLFARRPHNAIVRTYMKYLVQHLTFVSHQSLSHVFELQLELDDDNLFTDFDIK